MTRNEIDSAAIERACCGNPEAMDYLKLWSPMVHGVDDVEDRGGMTAEFRQALYILVLECSTHPFFLRHLRELKMTWLLVANAYADVLAWEKSDEPWKKEFVNVMRHAGMDMVLAVAAMCAPPNKGYEHMRRISQEWRTMCKFQHTDVKGENV